MAIFQTAYDTSACAGFRVRDVQDKLISGYYQGAYREVTVTGRDNEVLSLQLLQGGSSAADLVPFFNHPFLLTTSEKNAHGEKKKLFAVDVRNFGKWYAPNASFVVRNQPEYVWNIKRALLNQLWLTERPEIFRDLSTIPAAVYASLVSESIARRFALDAGEQATIMIVACYFYYCLFTNDHVFDEFAVNKIAGNIARVTRLPADKVLQVIDGMPVLNSLEELCNACRDKSGSIRLDDFNVGVLVAVLAGTWFGTNARENIIVGLEHIPTWLMIVNASLSEASFKRSVLTKISVRFDKGGAADSFNKSLAMLLGANLQEQLSAH